MTSASERYSHVIAEDASALHERIASGDQRLLVLWGHREVGRAALVEEAARTAGRPFRQMEARQLESWDGLRDITESGHFRTITIDTLLASGDPVDPSSYDLSPGEVLYIRGLNRAPGKILAAVFRSIVEERKLLNNPIPDDVQIVAGALPTDREQSLELLGADLEQAWKKLADRSDLGYPAHPLPDVLRTSSDHWGVLPSTGRFIDWGRRRGLADEVVGFFEDELQRDPAQAGAYLFAAILRESDPFDSLASPRSFSDLGRLLGERRLYFASRRVKQALQTARDRAEFTRFLTAEMDRWIPDRWIEAGDWNTLRGESVAGSEWLLNLRREVAAGTATVALDDVCNYAALERRSLAMWATQELGEEIGAIFVERTTVGPADFARLAESA